MLIAHCVLPEPVRPVMSQPRTKSSIDQQRPASRITGLLPALAAKSVHNANAAQRALAAHENGEASRRGPASAPAMLRT